LSIAADTERAAVLSDRAATASTDAVGDYLRRIGRFPLLTAEEETVLGRRIEVGLFAQERLDQNPDLDRATKGELAYLAREGRAAYQKFVCSNLKLVVSVAKRYSGMGLPLLDLIQEGNLGLDRAVKKFDYTRGFKFSTYAMWWIKQAISRSMADSGRLIRVPVHTAEKINTLSRAKRQLALVLGREPTIDELADETNLDAVTVQRLLTADRDPISLQALTGDSDAELGELLEDTDAVPVSDIVHSQVRDDELRRRVDALPHREAEILRFRYGLREQQPMTFAQVGAAVGISRERVRQLERHALIQLRCPELAGYID
jgi:RNA polymerase primary sigma factor